MENTYTMHNAYLIPLLQEAERLPQQFLDTFGELSVSQLNWKPQNTIWSIGENMNHLITCNEQYFQKFEQLLSGKATTPLLGKFAFWRKYCGNLVFNAVLEVPKRKSKTFHIFEPPHLPVTHSIFGDFDHHQKLLLQHIRQLDQVDHNRTYLSSPASKSIVFSLKDAIRILLEHEKRHFRQAKNLMKQTDFPQV
ncbi:DinB family protein [Rapidithrix thailandica]|uniref:DinB family protein n=1 Tax=Rapidithrix thailandica TaxID=413964 RepID=A0AAW9RWR9_9BACT